MKKLLLPIALVAATSVAAFAQSRVVKGRVLDETGEAVLGASVVIKGTQSGTVTDENGNFTISVPEGSNTLIISSLGLGTQEVTAGDGSRSLTVSFTQKSTELQEAVVIGYGTVNRKQFIGGSSVVKSDAFENKAMGSFTNMLQGKAPGVQITAQNGAPGSNAFIRVRGTGSLASGNAPLIVIDGVPSTADAYNALNPSDIKNISILKDASTTAIYGSRGTNGVLMVTTKRGDDLKAGDAKVTYGLQVGVKTKTPDKFKMMNSDQKLAFERELGYTNEYLVPLLTADGYSDISEVPENVLQGYYAKLKQNQTDWLSNDGPILRKGRMQQHDLSVSGRTDKLNYLISGQIYDEDGISYGSFFNRKTGGFAFDYQAKPWLKIGQTTRATYNTGRLLRDRYNAQNPFAAMYQYNSYESPYDFANGYNGYNFTTQGFNVVEAIQGNPSFYNNFYGSSATYAEIKPVSYITVRTQLGLQYNVYQQENFTKPGSILDFIVNGSNATGSKTDITRNRLNYVWTNTAEFKKTVNEDHNLSVLIGTEFTRDNYKSYSLSSTGFPSGVTTQENGAKPTATTTTRESWALMSYFGRLGYNYKGKYAASATLRTDGSSRFADETKFGTFWSLGGSWLMSDEAFITNKRTFSYLKLWATVGTSGNDQIGNYSYQQLYRFSNYANTPVGYPYQPANNELTWEKNLSYSFGLDFGLLNDRISGNINYYNRNTNGLIMENPISPTTGFTSRTENRGSMVNRGIEIQVQADVIHTQDFVWSVGANYTYNRNRVTDLGGKDTIPSIPAYLGYNVIGQPTDVYRMQKYAGIDPTTGAASWYAQDGSITTDYAQAGTFILDKKSADPKFFGGFNTSFSYKGIGLGLDFSYVGGLWTYNNQWKDFNSASNYFQNLAVDAADYWTPTNTGAKNPALDVGDNIYDSDRWLQKGDMLRLRNVTLSYNIPNSAVKKLKMENVRVYLQGQNLWYYAPGFKGDPEVGVGSAESDLNRQGNISLFSYPQTKAITFGLSVTF